MFLEHFHWDTRRHTGIKTIFHSSWLLHLTQDPCKEGMWNHFFPCFTHSIFSAESCCCLVRWDRIRSEEYYVIAKVIVTKSIHYKMYHLKVESCSCLMRWVKSGKRSTMYVQLPCIKFHWFVESNLQLWYLNCLYLMIALFSTESKGFTLTWKCYQTTLLLPRKFKHPNICHRFIWKTHVSYIETAVVDEGIISKSIFSAESCCSLVRWDRIRSKEFYVIAKGIVTNFSIAPKKSKFLFIPDS